MIEISTNLMPAVISNVWDFINSQAGTFTAVIIGIALILLFLEIISGHEIE